MNVLVVPEDPTHDRYILKPVVEQLFRDLERPARVDVLSRLPTDDAQERRAGRPAGVDLVLDQRTVAAIVDDNGGMVDLFVWLIDRDCDRRNNSGRAQDRQREHSRHLLACLAVEEVEVRLLALHADKLGVSWQDVRAECDPRERFAQPLLQREGWQGPGHGRKAAMRALPTQWRSLLSRCPELAELKQRVATWLETRG